VIAADAVVVVVVVVVAAAAVVVTFPDGERYEMPTPFVLK